MRALRLFHVVFSGEPPEAQSIAFRNDIIQTAFENWWISGRGTIYFHGSFSELPGTPITFESNGGNYHFLGPVTTSGGFSPTVANVHLYGMDKLGILPDTFDDDYFISGWGGVVFHSPDGGDYEYAFDENVGVMSRSGVSFTYDKNVTLSFDGLFSNAEADNPNARVVKNDYGLLYLNTTNMLQTGLGINQGLVVLRAPQTRLASVSPMNFADGTIELDGHNLLGYEFTFGNEFGADGAGSIRNSNRGRESLIVGDMPYVSSWDSQVQQFGGAGDIRYIGNITEPGVAERRVQKTGPGMLTFLGTSTFEGPVQVENGLLVLDYAVTNASKIGDSALVALRGGLSLVGSGESNTVETIGALRLGYESYGGSAPNHIPVSVQGRSPFTAELRIETLGHATTAAGVQQNQYPADFIVGEGCAVKVRNAANYPGAGIISPDITFNGKSFARFADEPDDDGYYAIEPLPDDEYAADFDSGTDFEIVDVKGAMTNLWQSADPDGESWWAPFVDKAVALRFDNPGASLTINGYVDLDGRPGAPAILVAPDSGSAPIIIDGTGNFFRYWNASFFIHQYNTNAPLHIKARIFGDASGNSLVKTGPGELILTEAENPFGELRILTGTVTTDVIVNSRDVEHDRDWYSPSGWSNITLGNGATLNYIGPQTETDRAIFLSGHAAIKSSGAGPIAFTSAATVTTQFGNANILTLDGDADGEIRGTLDLKAGGIVKTGAGAWTLADCAATNKFYCGAVVEEGKLILSRALGNDVTVKPNGTLAGSGHITRDLKLAGVLEFVPGSDALTVGRDIILDGATFTVAGRFPRGEYVEVLAAGGKITGAFADIPNKYKVRYNSNSIEVQERLLETLLIIK